MVIVSHDREFLDQLCTKVVETERGVATTYGGNYTQYCATKVGGGEGGRLRRLGGRWLQPAVAALLAPVQRLRMQCSLWWQLTTALGCCSLPSAQCPP
jgi:hypothetical protein